MQKRLELVAHLVLLWLIYTAGVWAGWDLVAVFQHGLPLINPLQAAGLVALVAFLTDLISAVAER